MQGTNRNSGNNITDEEVNFKKMTWLPVINAMLIPLRTNMGCYVTRHLFLI